MILPSERKALSEAVEAANAAVEASLTKREKMEPTLSALEQALADGAAAAEGGEGAAEGGAADVKLHATILATKEAIADVEGKLQALPAWGEDVAEGWLAECTNHAKELFVGPVEELFGGFTAACEEQLEAAEERWLVAGREAFEDFRERVRVAIEEEFADLVHNSHEALNQALEAALRDFDDAAAELQSVVNETCSGLGEAAAERASSRIEASVYRMVDSAVAAVIEELAENLALSQLSATVTGSLAPVMPQLVALKVAAEAIKEALRILRSGGF